MVASSDQNEREARHFDGPRARAAFEEPSSGDGAGISEQYSVSLIASSSAELLLVDVPDADRSR